MMMENELIFEHLINDKVSKCLRWADLYRGASVIDNNMHDAMKVGKVEMCLQIALDKLRQETTGSTRVIIEECYEKLGSNASFETIDDIITTLSKQNIIA